MKLSDENAQKILAFIQKKWGPKGQCDKCYQSAVYEFKPGEIRLFTLTEYQGGSLVIGPGQVEIPVLPLFCKNCGKVDLLNVNVVNEVQKEKPKEENPS